MHIDRIFSDADFDRMHKDDRVKCFINVPSWIKFCEDADLFVGNRFHGAVAAILAGAPHIFLPFDGRTRELSAFHHFTTLSPDCIKEDLRFSDYLDLLDFDSFNKYQDANFNNYLGFLENNGLNHIFIQQSGYEIGESPMERQVKCSYEIIPCMDSLTLLGKAKRIIACLPFFSNRVRARIHL
ncbi:MAG: polysaccharide pyruvyl transferase family protein [Bacteroidaceae bacterium]|nr:polysaccharide pyruvyl transferase family protein [Bacteroidaceae bacterium]